MGLHKTKNFCTAKEIINKVKRQPIEWQIRFANHISDKGLVSKYINNSYNSNTHTYKTYNPIEKQEEDLDFLQRKMYRQTIDTWKDGNIPNQGNTNQNHSEILLHACQNGYYVKMDKRNPCALLGM